MLKRVRRVAARVALAATIAVGLPVGGAIEGGNLGHKTSVKDNYGKIHTYSKEAEDAALGGAGGLTVDLIGAVGGVLLWDRRRVKKAYNEGFEAGQKAQDELA